MNRVINVRHIVRSPYDQIVISWEVDGSSGTSECKAWEGQHVIDLLVKAGYEVKSVSLAN